MSKQVDTTKALTAGFLGTAAMTIVMYGLPVVGIAPMDIMAALGSVFPLKVSPYILGGLIHFSIGAVLGLIYAAFFHSWLPGPNWLRGALFSLLPWLFAIGLLSPSLQLAARTFGATSTVANPCAIANPCALKPSNPCAVRPSNPCAAPANPCAAKSANPCALVNPCAVKAPANPCAPQPANPCAPVSPAQGGIPPQALSFVVHLIYGVLLGALYRPRA